ncbi:Serine hydrolase involved in the detoxification of formaldehyde [Nakaseomyces bracarensis]|uniref:S-formylglutathione hydrolase n=1 Tax=Nakaseomyces bracarensis TaxID=273131 RepID=A0ABR4NVI7_9SACH
MKLNKTVAVCGGKLLQLSHPSKVVSCEMDVNIYLPKQFYHDQAQKIPVIYYLSGLTCTPQNASEKAFWQMQADKYGFAVVYPDTSPRGEDVPSDPEGSWDFGKGAGFYINATKQPFSKHYHMYDYIHNELPTVLNEHFDKESNGKLDFFDNIAITGHSMGGFGALSGFLKTYEENKYKSCSAFAPIVNPSKVPWGQKAFKGYFDNEDEGKVYDPCELVKKVQNTHNSKILIHVGTNDPFLEKHLKPELLEEAIKGTTWDGQVEIKKVEGFDHSYYFISTFVPEHAEFHAKNLGLI